MHRSNKTGERLVTSCRHLLNCLHSSSNVKDSFPKHPKTHSCHLAFNAHKSFQPFHLFPLQLATSGWTTTYHFGCMLPDYSDAPEALRMLRFMWWTVVLKLLELFETCFFILRKRDRQASFLHVYHHIGTLVVVWSGCKYVGGTLCFVSLCFCLFCGLKRFEERGFVRHLIDRASNLIKIIAKRLKAIS